MQLGITMRINGATPQLSMSEVLEAERLGYRLEEFWRRPARRGRHHAEALGDDRADRLGHPSDVRPREVLRAVGTPEHDRAARARK